MPQHLRLLPPRSDRSPVPVPLWFHIATFVDATSQRDTWRPPGVMRCGAPPALALLISRLSATRSGSRSSGTRSWSRTDRMLLPSRSRIVAKTTSVTLSPEGSQTLSSSYSEPAVWGRSLRCSRARASIPSSLRAAVKSSTPMLSRASWKRIRVRPIVASGSRNAIDRRASTPRLQWIGCLRLQPLGQC